MALHVSAIIAHHAVIDYGMMIPGCRPSCSEATGLSGAGNIMYGRGPSVGVAPIRSVFAW